MTAVRENFFGILTFSLLPMVATAAWAQDYNPDGTPTIRNQCLQNPGMCERSPSGSYSSGLDDLIGRYILEVLRERGRHTQSQAKLQSEYDNAEIFFAEDKVSDIVGVWAGYYFCRQGKTGMTLNLNYLNDRSVQGTIDFYPVVGGPQNIPNGNYTVRVLIGHTNVFVEPLRWIRRPSGYELSGMFGLIGDGGNSFSGELALSGCSNFALVKIK